MMCNNRFPWLHGGSFNCVAIDLVAGKVCAFLLSLLARHLFLEAIQLCGVLEAGLGLRQGVFPEGQLGSLEMGISERRERLQVLVVIPARYITSPSIKHTSGQPNTHDCFEVRDRDHIYSRMGARCGHPG
jgi:hypothetical protein